MRSETEFRGVAGEVIRGFISVGIIGTLVSVLLSGVVLVLITALLTKVFGLPSAFAGLILVAGTSPLIGHFALSAREGNLQAGLLTSRVGWGPVFAFAARHVVLCLAWGLPLAFVAQFLLKDSAQSLIAFSAPEAGTGIGLLIVAVVAVVAHLLSLLIATKTDSLSEAFTAEAWRWVLTERRADLVPMVATLLGGLVVFSLLCWPLLGVVSLMLIKASPKIGVAVAAFTYAAPALGAPILLGRLCGAFVFGETPGREEIPSTPLARPAGSGGRPVRPTLSGSPALQTHPIPTPVTVPATTALPDAPPLELLDSPPPAAPPRNREVAIRAAQRLDPNQALEGLRVRLTSDPAGALTEALVLRDAHPVNPRVAVFVAETLKEQGQATEATAAASHAIRVALSAGAAPVAVELWNNFSAQRQDLDLDLPNLETLGKQLLTRKALTDAAWCFQAMKSKDGDSLRVQKGFISVAEAATKEGNTSAAARVYRHILQEFPDSTLREFIENALVQVERH